MLAAALVMVLASGDALQTDGALTGVARFSEQRGVASAGGDAHLLVTLRSASGPFFAEARASLLLSADTSFSLTRLAQDLGSTLSFGVRPRGAIEELRLIIWPMNSVTALPVFDWANKTGEVAPTFNPAVSAQMALHDVTFWATLRFKPVFSAAARGDAIRPDVMGGISARLPSGFQLDARAAWFQLGDIQTLAQVGVMAPADSLMASGRIAWAFREAVGPALDLDRYATDPWRFERFFVPEERASSVALWAALEGGGGRQVLVNPDVYAATTLQPYAWLDAQLRVRVENVRLFLTGRVQTASHVRADAPGVPPYVAFSESVSTAPMLSVLAGADATWRSARLTPGVLMSVTRPAFVHVDQPQQGGNPIPGLGNSWFVVLDGNRAQIISSDHGVRPILTAKVSLRWDPLPNLTVAGEVNVVKDWNAWTWVDSVNSIATPTFDARLLVRGQLWVQARF